jgi:hypothetical protein
MGALSRRGPLAAGYLGVSAQLSERTYGHHHPDYMRGAAEAITSKQSHNVSLVVSLVEPENDKAKRQKPNAWWANKDKTGHWIILIQLPLLKWRRQKVHEKPGLAR